MSEFICERSSIKLNRNYMPKQNIKRYTQFTIRPPEFAFKFIVYLLTSAQNELDEQTEIDSLSRSLRFILSSSSFCVIFTHFLTSFVLMIWQKKNNITNPIPSIGHFSLFLNRIFAQCQVEIIEHVSWVQRKGKRALHSNNSHYRLNFGRSERKTVSNERNGTKCEWRRSKTHIQHAQNTHMYKSKQY